MIIKKRKKNKKKKEIVIKIYITQILNINFDKRLSKNLRVMSSHFQSLLSVFKNNWSKYVRRERLVNILFIN